MLPWIWADGLLWFSSGVTELLVDSLRMINRYSECFVNSMQVTHGRCPPPHHTMQWDGGCNTHIWVIDDLRDALRLHPGCCGGENLCPQRVVVLGTGTLAAMVTHHCGCSDA